MESIKDVLSKRDWDKGRYIKHEWQDFGYRLAVELKDLDHRSLYMKLAKNEDRKKLQKALDFSKDYKKDRAKLFMWKLKRLRDKIDD
ncbi:MAG: hypothetical protein ABIJ36_02490 [Patescibacteria group bacterium]|nr:hypothetical protein [Patescibacteria group bacterium]